MRSISNRSAKVTEELDQSLLDEAPTLSGQYRPKAGDEEGAPDTIACSHCGADCDFRIRRKAWMRLIPGSARYLCTACGHKTLLLFNRWRVRLFF